MAIKNEGWVFLDNAAKAHYFRAGRALCGKWAWVGEAFGSPDGIPTTNRCKTCSAKRTRETERKS